MGRVYGAQVAFIWGINNGCMEHFYVYKDRRLEQQKPEAAQMYNTRNTDSGS